MIQERFEELRELIAENDLSRATRRLLDFFTDFPLPKALMRKSIALRAAYNAYSQMETGEAADQKRQSLVLAALELTDEIEDTLFPETAENQEGDPSFDELREKYFRDKKKSGGGKNRPDVVFEGKGISKTFQTPNYTFKLPELDLKLKMGQITGIVGENGNGKTTLLRIVAGDLEADKGRISYPNFDLRFDDWYHIKQQVAYIPQRLPSWKGFLKENLNFTAAIHGIKGKENEEQVEFIIHRLGLSKYEEALWSEVSSGFRLRFELARALVWRPRLLIIDEPLANLDINTQQLFLQDLQYLAKSSKYPLAILLSSQHLHEVESIADNIVFIKNGETLYNGPMQEFGKDREENLFELSTPLSKSELGTRLQAFENIRIEDTGKSLLIGTPLEISGSELLQELVKQAVQVNYFRDISTSTLKLFR